MLLSLHSEWDSVMAWSIILSVHGVDPFAEVRLLISHFLRCSIYYEINYWAVVWIRITLMRIRIRLITLMRTQMLSGFRFLFDADADPDLDPTFHPNANSDPNP